MWVMISALFQPFVSRLIHTLRHCAAQVGILFVITVMIGLSLPGKNLPRVGNRSFPASPGGGAGGDWSTVDCVKIP